MNDILKPSGDNIGGLQKLEFIPINDIENISSPIDGKVDEPVLKENKRWYDCYFSPGSLGFNETKKLTDNGTQYSTELNPFIPRDTPEISSVLREMDGHLFLIKYRDNNGYLKLVGDLDVGLHFESLLNTGSAAADRNGHQLKFFALTSHKAWFINE